MPRIKRWFPVSQDIHADPEFWELRDTFGDRAGFVWLEILSIADRNGGDLPGQWESYPTLLAARCRSTRTRLRVVCNWLQRWLALDSEGHARIANYWKYHRTEERKPIPTRESIRSLPSEPSEPSNPKKDIEEPTNPNTMSVKDFVDSWNLNLTGKLPTVDWPVSQSRRTRIKARLREHPEIEFWEIVFGNILDSKFLLGFHTSKNGHENWKCTLDFLIANDTNCVKIKEGQYDNSTR